tara:strand:+ start:5832 stop:7052 length:1221 start_codon:yes stop_codon:yes gene_type:complete
MAKTKAYINRDARGNFIPGSVVFSATKPKNGNYALIVAGVEQNNSVISNPEGSVASAYTRVIRKTYPRAQVASNFANGLVNWIKADGYFPENVLLGETKCSDDVNAPVFSNLKNIGQTPEAISQFGGSFQAGGLGGVQHTGTLGLQAFISHQFTTDKKNALLLVQTPHIGISEKGYVGRIVRKGKVSERTDNTCGAVATAVNWLINTKETAMPSYPNPEFTDNYQYYSICNILFGAKTTLITLDKVFKGEALYGARMKMACDLLVESQNMYNFGDGEKDGILNSSDAKLGKPGLIPSMYADDMDVYVLTGTFINTDYTTPGHIDVNSFKKINNSVVYDMIENIKKGEAIKEADDLIAKGVKTGNADLVAEGKRLLAIAQAMPETIKTKVGNKLIITDITKKFIKSL